MESTLSAHTATHPHLPFLMFVGDLRVLGHRGRKGLQRLKWQIQKSKDCPVPQPAATALETETELPLRDHPHGSSVFLCTVVTIRGCIA